MVSHIVHYLISFYYKIAIVMNCRRDDISMMRYRLMKSRVMKCRVTNIVRVYIPINASPRLASSSDFLFPHFVQNSDGYAWNTRNCHEWEVPWTKAFYQKIYYTKRSHAALSLLSLSKVPSSICYLWTLSQKLDTCTLLMQRDCALSKRRRKVIINQRVGITLSSYTGYADRPH